MQLDTILNGDCLDRLKELDDNSIDLLCTDPPYGYSFMGKDWDKAVPSVEVWKECLRVLKPGAFAFIMSAPRQDVLSQMIVRIGEAGFDTDFTSIYWTYASGFPKAMNIGKMVDKRNGRDQDTYRPFADYLKQQRTAKNLSMKQMDAALGTNTAYSWWEGRSAGVQRPTKAYYFQLKTILDLDDRFDELIEREEAEREVIGKIEKTNSFVARGGYRSDGTPCATTDLDITLPATEKAKALDGSYGGFQPKPAVEVIIVAMKPLSEKTFVDQALKNGKGITWLDDARIPAEKLVGWSGGGRNSYSATTGASRGGEQGGYNYDEGAPRPQESRFPANLLVSDNAVGEEHSRYFDLDRWAIENLPPHVQNVFPFLIVPKPSKREKAGSKHPTIKPIRLMSYLLTLGSRAGDVVLDPFCGSGTTCVAARILDRHFIGIEKELEYCLISNSRLAAYNTLRKAS